MSRLPPLAGCSTPPSDARVKETLPDRTAFPVVADLLEHRCGSFDCHGTRYRNLRLYGSEGLRLDDAGRPSSQLNTTAQEYDQDYASVVSLEPELMTLVVSQSGAGPERLTMIRKARGVEDHKGGKIWQAGDESDTCVTAWLAGATDAGACIDAKNTSP
jgi:hypothetical protein